MLQRRGKTSCMSVQPKRKNVGILTVELERWEFAQMMAE